ncbi:hypothetical protein [Thermosulfurimonas sp. F29]|uniref:hypothetical protein n=1 Tax=Thermosulfurimonas sp. F29 TaxID=2867247 RepID=UPI001C8361FB|nr:hypothetical protein [Thermosulfurimonas sp. F29]MBX6422212.1 hypothetical protein [Thermosulfurimonas sp. F29]
MADPTVGKWIAPIIYLGAAVLLANGLLHLDPERRKSSERVVGVITFVVGVMWWPFLIAMMMEQGLGPITNFVTGLAGMYAFAFTALGACEIWDLKPRRQLGAVFILIGWLTLAYGVYWLVYPTPKWIYHFSIAFVWFVAMNLAGFFMNGKVSEKVLGYVVTFAALYTFAIPAILWSMPPGHQGPF